MFFWKSKEEEKEERFSVSLLILLALFLPALLIISGIRFLMGRQAGAPSPARQVDKQAGAQKKSTGSGEKSYVVRAGKSPEAVKEAAGQKRAKQKQTQPDDLTRIEGIGPKTVEVLRGHGITTFRQLADTSVERLNEIMGEAGFRINPPDTWPEQARLAADDQSEALDAMQERLHAGRREKK
jgi:predicted flap endonuclease-1-like 5' DNA nuclease